MGSKPRHEGLYRFGGEDKRLCRQEETTNRFERSVIKIEHIRRKKEKKNRKEMMLERRKIEENRE